MRRFLLVAVAVGVIAACSPDPRTRAFKVMGTVTFDGEPVPDGSISLMPDDPTLPGDAGSIENGQFSFQASAGRKKVMIRASREVPHRGPANVPHDPVFADYIPEKYHEKSEVYVEVTPGGENRFDFALQSK